MRLGIDLGGTAIKSGMVDETGQVHFAETTSTNTASGREAVLDALTEACKSQLKHEDVPSIGIGIPGFVDVENGILVRSANLPLDDTPIAEILSKNASATDKEPENKYGSIPTAPSMIHTRTMYQAPPATPSCLLWQRPIPIISPPKASVIAREGPKYK